MSTGGGEFTFFRKHHGRFGSAAIRDTPGLPAQSPLKLRQGWQQEIMSP